MGNHEFNLVWKWTRERIGIIIVISLIVVGSAYGFNQGQHTYVSLYDDILNDTKQQLDVKTVILNDSTLFYERGVGIIFDSGIRLLKNTLETYNKIVGIKSQLEGIYVFIETQVYLIDEKGTSVLRKMLITDQDILDLFSTSIGLSLNANSVFGIGSSGSFQISDGVITTYSSFSVNKSIDQDILNESRFFRESGDIDFIISFGMAQKLFYNYNNTLRINGFVFMNYTIETLERNDLTLEVANFAELSKVPLLIQTNGMPLFEGRITSSYEVALNTVINEVSQMELFGLLFLTPLVLSILLYYVLLTRKLVVWVIEELDKLRWLGIPEKRRRRVLYGFMSILIFFALFGGLIVYSHDVSKILTIGIMQAVVLILEIRFRGRSSRKILRNYRELLSNELKQWVLVTVLFSVMAFFLHNFFILFSQIGEVGKIEDFFISYLKWVVIFAATIGLLQVFIISISFIGVMKTLRKSNSPKRQVRTRMMFLNIFKNRYAILLLVVLIVPNWTILSYSLAWGHQYDTQAKVAVGSDYRWEPYQENLTEEVQQNLSEKNYVEFLEVQLETVNFGTINALVISNVEAMQDVMYFPTEVGLSVSEVTLDLMNGSIFVDKALYNFVNQISNTIFFQFQFNNTIPNSFIGKYLRVSKEIDYFPSFLHQNRNLEKVIIMGENLFQELNEQERIIQFQVNHYLLLNNDGYKELKNQEYAKQGRTYSLSEERDRMVPIFIKLINIAKLFLFQLLLLIIFAVGILIYRTLANDLLLDYIRQIRYRVTSENEARLDILISLGMILLITNAFALIGTRILIVFFENIRIDRVPSYPLPILNVSQAILQELYNQVIITLGVFGIVLGTFSYLAWKRVNNLLDQRGI